MQHNKTNKESLLINAQSKMQALLISGISDQHISAAAETVRYASQISNGESE
jgi:hypothetical protein